MALLKRKPEFVATPDATWADDSAVALFQSLPSLLASGGDQRLTLTGGVNAYGCKPQPDPRLLDFASSTASTISEAAYACAACARDALLYATARDGSEQAFDDAVERARRALRRHLDIGEAEVLFTPSGTDAQLQVLFLTKALFGNSTLTTIIVGSDQTGSGTAYTSLGRHFSAVTSRGDAVEKNGAISGLADGVATIAVPFCHEGRLRSGAEMDAAVIKVVAEAIAAGSKVLLQVMDSSKLGWRTPSAECLAEIEERWPHEVCVVVDACQLRTGPRRLKDFLARNWPVLITGSKFFTGPAFSGALLLPPAIADALDGLTAAPRGLSSYATCFDVPRRWPALRSAFPRVANFGQWLRWEAALEEMRAYFAVPENFRDRVLAEFAVRLPKLIATAKNLRLLSEHAGEESAADDGELCHPTVFSFVPHHRGEALSAETCARLHRALRLDLSHYASSDDAELARRACQVGQPVALKHRQGSVLRLCASARLVTRCWSLEEKSAEAAVATVLDEASATIAKLDWLAGRPDILETLA
jgi:flavin-binding protein dodecin